MIESSDQDWGLCDHYLVVRDLDDDDVEADYGDEDDDSPLRVHPDRRTAAGACCSPHMTRGEPGRRWREEECPPRFSQSS